MGKVKVLFVIPPYYNYGANPDNSITSQLPSFTIPYGVLSLAAYAKEHAQRDVEFQLLDLNLQAYSLMPTCTDFVQGLMDLLTRKLTEFEPEIVAISALFNSCYDYIGPITATVKTMRPDALTVIGGGLATNLYRELFRSFEQIDGACFGEGEIPLCGLLDASDRADYLRSSPAWITREDMEAGKLPQPELLVNLDEIPFFDYQLIDLKSYASRSVDKRYAGGPKREMSIHTSRGCPFDCVFCANGKVHGKKVRYMSVQKVAAEVEQMVREYGIDVLLIEDDHFLSDRQRAKAILKEIARHQLKVEFPNGIAVYGIDEEIGALLKEAGVTTISLAIESGSDYVLRQVIKKPLVVKMIEPAVRILKQNDIDVHAFIVTGLPGETAAHRAETRQMLYDIGFDWVKIYIAIPIAGSRLFDICKEHGYIANDSYLNFVTTRCVIRAPEIDPDDLEREVYLTNLDLNFVNNFNIRSGDYRKAIIYLENIAKRYPTHALCHHALALAYQGTGVNSDLAERHRARFREIVASDPLWRSYAGHFGLA